VDDGPTVQELLSRRKSAEDALRAARDLLEHARRAIERGESSIEEFAASVARQLQPPLRALRLFAHGVRARRSALPADAVSSAERIDAEAERLQREIAELLAERAAAEPASARAGAAAGAFADPPYERTAARGNGARKWPAMAGAPSALVAELVQEINDPLTAVNVSLELLAAELDAVREQARAGVDAGGSEHGLVENAGSAHALDAWLGKILGLLDDARGGADQLCKVVSGLKLAVRGGEPAPVRADRPRAASGSAPRLSRRRLRRPAASTRHSGADDASDAGAERETSRPPRVARVLVVDDDAAIVQVVRTVLRVDHEVVGTTCVREALDRLTAGEHYDLILCDVIMPQMTGTELYEQLQRTRPEQARRVVLMTGGVRAHGPRDDAASMPVVLEKPFDVRSLLALVSDHVGR
jgi:CheY-like chemotaxis protein